MDGSWLVCTSFLWGVRLVGVVMVGPIFLKFAIHIMPYLQAPYTIDAIDASCKLFGRNLLDTEPKELSQTNIPAFESTGSYFPNLGLVIR